MSVRKRKWTARNGEVKEAWIVDYVDQEGDRHIETFKKKKDADVYQATVRVDVRRGIHTAPSKSITVEQASENWINRVTADDRERTTIRQYRQHIDLHILPRIGGAKLSNLTSKVVEDFRDDLLNSLSRPMARKVLTSLKSLLKVAKHAHVTADISIGRNKRSERRLEIGRDIPTTGEVKRLISTAPDLRSRTLLLTVALTGLQASELRGLRWTDVDFNAAELHVRQRADRYNAIGAPKSTSSVRSVPLPPELLTTLKKWKLACPIGDAGVVFPSSTGAVEHHAKCCVVLARSCEPPI